MSTFQGFPPGLFTFFDDLGKDNSKAFWQANRERWEGDVHTPMLALLDDLEDEFAPMRMFRPNRDVRFSKDKSPYRLEAAAISTSQAIGGIGYYVGISATELTTGYGAMVFARDQLERFRAAIDNDESGAAFEDIRQTLAEKTIPVSSGAEPPLKRLPRGYSDPHTRDELMRWKGAVVVQTWEQAAWMQTPEALDRIRALWREVEPLKGWLERYVGKPEPTK